MDCNFHVGHRQASHGHGSERTPANGACPDVPCLMAGTVASAARCCDIILFGKYTVSGVLDDATLHAASRDLDVAELWGGVAAVTAAALSKGYRAEAFDINRVPGLTDVDGPMCEDLTTELGLQKAMSQVLRLRPGALLAMAPVCSTFVFPNTSNTKRSSKCWQGDESYLPVQHGNLMAREAAFLMCAAVARDVHFFIENPAGSMIFSFLQSTLDLFPGLAKCIGDRCAYSMEPLGQRFKKPYKFVTSGPWLTLDKCTCPGVIHEKLMASDEQGRVTGNLQSLRASAAYPAALGAAIVEAWEGARSVATYDLVQMSNVQTPKVRPAAKRKAAACGRPARSRSPLGPWGDERSLPSQPSPRPAASHTQRASQGQPSPGPWGSEDSAVETSDTDPWA